MYRTILPVLLYLLWAPPVLSQTAPSFCMDLDEVSITCETNSDFWECPQNNNDEGFIVSAEGDSALVYPKDNPDTWVCKTADNETWVRTFWGVLQIVGYQIQAAMDVRNDSLSLYHSAVYDHPYRYAIGQILHDRGGQAALEFAGLEDIPLSPDE